MPDTGLLFLSLLCIIAAASCILFPKGLSKISVALNKTVKTFDDGLMRHRYVFGVLLFAVSYLFFRLALLVPQLRS